MTDSSNPLLGHQSFPDFPHIKPVNILPALQQVIAESRVKISTITHCVEHNWQHVMAPLEEMDDALHRVWGPVAHLNAVCDSDALRAQYQQGVQVVASWQSEVAQNDALYQAVKGVQASTDFSALNPDQQQSVLHTLRDLRLAGAELDDAAKARFKAIQMRLSELSTAFEQHTLDATRAFSLHIKSKDEMNGLPASICAAAAQRASLIEKDGWLFTLDIPSYLPFMQHAENRVLREQVYTAYVRRASEGVYDNTGVIREILLLRQEAARLLGFPHYGAYSLASKMAETTDDVLVFLRELAAKSRKMAEGEVSELKEYARDHLHISQLEAWDIAYASEKLRQHRYDISQETLKPWFSENKVLNGMFRLVEKLYGIQITEVEAPKWHQDARFFNVKNALGEVIAGFYFDAYAREHKRGGAWMDECRVRWQQCDGTLQIPIAYLICNFDMPIGEKPALWTHDEVTTLFHEFGHGLHHMLTCIDVRGVSGINGVPWDAVELPSQFMENFCWEREVVDLFAHHYETDALLPDELFDKMKAAKNFQSAMQMLRQVEFSLFDMLLHTTFNPEDDLSVQSLLDAVREEVAVITPPAYNRFQNSFSHIFAGGYGAGYYSYKWAEVLSADAFSAFEEQADEKGGVVNRDVAQRFRQEILSVGGSRDMMENFSTFRGRKPSTNALLRHSGIC
ncbi:MAG: M3 family metallopeptidase [Mariprofundaceae bacterium]